MTDPYLTALEAVPDVTAIEPLAGGLVRFQFLGMDLFLPANRAYISDMGETIASLMDLHISLDTDKTASALAMLEQLGVVSNGGEFRIELQSPSDLGLCIKLLADACDLITDVSTKEKTHGKV